MLAWFFLSMGKLEREFFVWSRESGCTVAVYKEMVPDAVKPFFFDDAGHHILRMEKKG